MKIERTQYTLQAIKDWKKNRVTQRDNIGKVGYLATFKLLNAGAFLEFEDGTYIGGDKSKLVQLVE